MSRRYRARTQIIITRRISIKSPGMGVILVDNHTIKKNLAKIQSLRRKPICLTKTKTNQMNRSQNTTPLQICAKRTKIKDMSRIRSGRGRGGKPIMTRPQPPSPWTSTLTSRNSTHRTSLTPPKFSSRSRCKLFCRIRSCSRLVWAPSLKFSGPWARTI